MLVKMEKNELEKFTVCQTWRYVPSESLCRLVVSASLQQTLQEGRKDSNVNIQLMAANISRCENVITGLRSSQLDPLHSRALASLSSSLSASREVLTRKICQLNAGPVPDNSTNTDTGAGGDVAAEGGQDGHSRARQAAIAATIVPSGDTRLSDVIGLAHAKQALHEAVVMPTAFPHLFLGGRQPWRRILLYGPPGTGKSRLARAVASEVRSAFYSVSSADLVSAWVGESEKLIKELFTHATNQPGRSVIFIDEIDSLCRQRSAREDEGSRRMKTELLKQMDGAHVQGSDTVFLVCATNCPWELDSAFLRRFQKRIYIPLPDREARAGLLRLHSRTSAVGLGAGDWERLAGSTAGYSGSDLATLTMGALMQPIRDLHSARHWRRLPGGRFTPCSAEQQGAFLAKLSDLPPNKVTPRDVSVADFVQSIATHRPTVSPEELDRFRHFTQHLGDSG